MSEVLEEKSTEGREAVEVPQEGEGALEYNEAGLEKLVNSAHEEVDRGATEVVGRADERINAGPESFGLDKQTGDSMLASGGFGERINTLKANIATLAAKAKAKIADLFDNKPEVIHFSEMATPVPKSAEVVKEDNPETGAPEVKAIGKEKQANVEETSEQKEKRELREYVEAEVFKKFGLTKEDEDRMLAEVPEARREILARSFENTRASLETFYQMQVVEGALDWRAIDNERKRLTYELLNPILEESISEIQPRLAELGIDISPDALGFNPATANPSELDNALNVLHQKIEFTARDRVMRAVADGLSQKGEYRGVTVATKEQMADQAFMQDRDKRLQMAENEAIREILEPLGFSEWSSETRTKLRDTFSRSQPEVDGNQFRVRKTREEITDLLNEEKGRADGTNFLCVNISAEKFENVLAEGGFRDIFSLDEQQMEEMQRVGGRGGEFYMKQRKAIEEALGIYDPETPTIYGTYASENGRDEKVGGSEMYGSIFLKLKPSVEATFCEGDSMSEGNIIAGEKLREAKYGWHDIATQWVESAKARQIAPEHASLIKSISNVNENVENQHNGRVGSFGYLEAQIKGLKLEDIESVNISRWYAEGKSKSRGYYSLFKKLQQDPNWKDKINIVE
jgi:hypothetical protein